jgi:hypothetical protein
VARLYADADLSRGLVLRLRAHGHDILTAHNLGLQDAPDPQHLLFAAQNGRTLLTNNGRHFQLLYIAWHLWSTAWGVQPRHAGIVVLPHWPPHNLEMLAQGIDQFLAATPTLANALYQFDPRRGWVQL